MPRLLICLLSFVAFAWVGSAKAQLAPTPPTKTVYFYNNSRVTVYPFIQSPRYDRALPSRDLWMQAQLKVPKTDDVKRGFYTTVVYRVYINRDTGIPPGKSVAIKMPFYTQLKGYTQANRGTIDDQFIDWWNANRIYVFDGKDAANAAYIYNEAGMSPGPVTPVGGAISPSCTSTDTTCTLLMKTYTVNSPGGILAQLLEYTFGSALIDFTIDNSWVNFNASGVDWVYLPVGIGAHGVTDPKQKPLNTWLGSNMSVGQFLTVLSGFGQGGSLWPQFVPSYYLPDNPIKPYWPNPPAGKGIKPYPQPEIPSANTVYAESFRTTANGEPFTPDPPVLTSNTNMQNHWGILGDVAEATMSLWNNCTQGGGTTTTCQKIQVVNKFFTDDWGKCFPSTPLPPTTDFLREVYGWAQFPGCPTDLVTTLGKTRYNQAAETYCDLQYNFFDPNVPLEEYFNPYVQLVHVKLASNAYAFSIDDAVSFKHIQGDGVVVTVGPGTRGFEDPNQQPLPTAQTYKTYCRPPA